MAETCPPPPPAAPLKVAKSTVKAALRYRERLSRGDVIMRDAAGRMQWASGKSVAPRTVRYMLDQGQIFELDTDLFGDRSRGQTIGKETCHG